MNTSAEKHLAKARAYLAKGEEQYLKAAKEMAAAKEEGATWAEIGARLGHEKSWCLKVMAWSKDVSAPTPFTEPQREKTDVRGARTILRNAPMEQVEQIIADLPPERQKKVAAAAGHEYLKARTELDEEEQRRTISQNKEREAAKNTLSEPGREAKGGFASLGIIGHIEQATDELDELIADASVTKQGLRGILAAHDRWVEKVHLASAMVGVDVEVR